MSASRRLPVESLCPTRRIATMMLAMSAAAATWAAGATVPMGAEVRVRRPSDVAEFERVVALRYHVTFRRVVAADIDRDGDLDVVAATDRGFVFWVNDGAGRLTFQAQRHLPGIDGLRSSDTWRGHETRSDETIQNDLPTSRPPSRCAHAPPMVLERHEGLPAIPLAVDTARSEQAPRAPPR